MGAEAIYKCKNCGNRFKSREGGGFFFFDCRCVNCDTIKIVRTRDRGVAPEEFIPPSKKDIGVCKKCGAELRNDIKPMCPKCKSRNVEAKDIVTFYD